MTDVEVLAGHARRALAATCGGVLRIEGIGELGRRDLEVLLYEDDGEPRFLCEAGSPVARAGARQRTAVLEVGCCRRSGCRRAVRFAGHLSIVDTDEVDGLLVHVVGLALHQIEVSEPGGATAAVPLARYHADAGEDAQSGHGEVHALHGRDPSGHDRAGGTDEDLGSYAERVVRHTNQVHGGALRETAARTAGTASELVLAAELADLDDGGVTLAWIGIDGAHSHFLGFPHPARTPGELAVLLRTVLTGPQPGAP